jgi:transportin-1
MGPVPAGNTPEALALNYVKSTILLGLNEKDQMIRQTAGTVVASMLGSEESGGWPEALDALMKGMASQDDNVVEVSQLSPSLLMWLGYIQYATKDM